MVLVYKIVKSTIQQVSYCFISSDTFNTLKTYLKQILGLSHVQAKNTRFKLSLNKWKRAILLSTVNTTDFRNNVYFLKTTTKTKSKNTTLQ